MAHLNFLVLLLRPLFPSRTRVLVRQNGTVSAALAFGDLPAYTRLLYRCLYPHANRVICQSDAMAKDLNYELGLAHDLLAVLPNPIDVEAIRATPEASPAPWSAQDFSRSGPHLLAVGRLAREKGFDLLLQALAAVRKRFHHADLLIAGAGPEQANLEAECHALGLDASVHFAGSVLRPSGYFPGASLFVLSSRHEGLPNALLEAAAAGLPIVALPASGGIVELFQDRPGVWLVAEISSAALAASLINALEAVQRGQRFAHSFIEEFRLDCAIQSYEGLIDSVLAESVLKELSR